MAEDFEDGASAEQKKFPCVQCGAEVAFVPGTEVVACPYCSHAIPIPQSADDIEELDFRAYVAEQASQAPTEEHETVRCASCAAVIDRPADMSAFTCPYCDSDIIPKSETMKLIRPQSLLPFKITREKAGGLFRAWVGGLWFAPSKLAQYARRDHKLVGMYIPYWTYDANTTSWYEGQRGDDYWVTESYQTRDAQGNMSTQTRQVRKTRWSSVSGTVWNQFDDVLVAATRTLPAKQVDELEPWDLENLVPYAEDYLSGFTAQCYQIDLEAGFVLAKGIMDEGIRSAICRDIGGDHQRISSVRTQHDDVSFKHLLAPIWISSYRFGERVFRFLVNGRTGEVQGERPYSAWKIAFLVLLIAAVIGAIVYFAR